MKWHIGEGRSIVDNMGYVVANINFTAAFEKDKEHKNLIAAAPELLEATKILVEMLSPISSNMENIEVYDLAVKALNKANGI